MSTNDTTAVEGTDTEPRTVRALTEYLTALPDGPDRYSVVSQSGSTYTVDTDAGTCTCPDHEHREPAGGCKHRRRVAFATGREAIPGAVDRTAVDPHLGMHVAGTARVAVTDGGQAVAASEGTETDECDECAALPDDFPCWACVRDGRRAVPE